MAQPYVGEIRIFAGNFAPAGWMQCDGQVLPISEYETLFNLIGTTYGGDGQSTFALPDLRGRLPVHMGSNGSTTYTLAENGGVETVTLTVSQIPTHTHLPAANTTANQTSPANSVWAATTLAADRAYNNSSPTPLANMKTGLIDSVGGSQPHDNMSPFLALNYIISLFGIFPSQT